MKKLCAKLLVIINTALALNCYAGPTDAQLKAKLCGYWVSPRHAYIYRADGTWRMMPDEGPYAATTNGTWSIKEGVLYEDYKDNAGPVAYKILKLNDKEFVFRELNADPVSKDIATFHMTRVSRAKAETY
jgi:hypothetical protein